MLRKLLLCVQQHLHLRCCGEVVRNCKKATPWWQKFKSWLRLWCVALGKMATGQLTLQNRQLVCGKCVQRRLVCGVQMYFVLAKLGTRGAKLAILSASVRNACNVLRLHPSELWNYKKSHPVVAKSGVRQQKVHPPVAKRFGCHSI